MKKILSIVLALAMLLALAIPTLASAKLPAASEGFAFHCNDIEGENGRTYIVGKDKDYGRFDKKTGEGLIQLAPAPGDTTGKIWVPVEDLGVCTACGRSDWVSFSNKSGTPDGKNIQLQHPGPSKRWITIKVIYNVEIPACEWTCVNDDAKCEFECTCGGVCAKEAIYPGHAPCTWECGEGHDCIFDDPDLDLTCGTVCNCKFSLTETIVTLKKKIVIADGFLFEHTAPATWEGGALVSGSPISELLFNDKTYFVFYEGAGDCKCECEPVVCDAKCELCDYIPTGCEHIAICDNCKNGNGNNHKNCERANPESNTNYFCKLCGMKLGSYHVKKGWLNDIVLECHCDCH